MSESTVQSDDLAAAVVTAPSQRTGDGDGDGGAAPDGEEPVELETFVVPQTLLTLREQPTTVTVTTLGRAWRALVEAVGVLTEDRRRLWALETGVGERP